MLVAAAEEEAAAFRQLRDRWQPNGVALFELVEAQRAAARAQRTAEVEMVAAARSDAEVASLQAPEPSATPMTDAPEPAVSEQEAAMPYLTEDFEAFGRAYQNLLAEWDAFHQLYDEWRRTEEGCGRSAAIQSI